MYLGTLQEGSKSDSSNVSDVISAKGTNNTSGMENDRSTLKKVLKKSTPVEEESKSYLDLNALNEESEELYEELPACDSSHDNLQVTQQKTLQDLPFKPRPVPRQRQPFSSIAVVTDDRMAQQTSESVHVDDSTALDK